MLALWPSPPGVTLVLSSPGDAWKVQLTRQGRHKARETDGGLPLPPGRSREEEVGRGLGPEGAGWAYRGPRQGGRSGAGRAPHARGRLSPRAPRGLLGGAGPATGGGAGGRGRGRPRAGLAAAAQAAVSQGSRRAVVASATMGQIEWAMWANEQALASGLSECAPRPRAAGRAGGGAETSG